MSTQAEESVCVLNGRVKNEKIKFTPLSPTHTENSNQVSPIALEKKVESGLYFILKHLSGPQFPRSISTPTLGGAQKEVSYKDTAILYYQGALWTDCRISAFYPGQKNPDLIFIDLDKKDFCSERAFKTALTNILKRIRERIGGYPSILLSGNGVHLILPIDCPIDLDTEKEYADLVHDKDVNKAFLQFASSYLSDDKRDSCNSPSLKSCLLRIPGSINGKCDQEVKILQEWDGFRPDVKLLLGSFHSYLIDKKLNEDQRCEELASRFPLGSSDHNGVTRWIEQLMETPIDDYRKRSRDLIIVPYLVVRKGMTDIDEIEAIVMKWADKCGELYPLEPSRDEYAKRIRYRVKKVMRNMIPPMRFDTLQEENPALAQGLIVEVGK